MAAPKGNKYAQGNDGGRPALFKTPEELEMAIREYFDNPPDKRKVTTDAGVFELPVYSICGLAYHLGFESRQSFYDYEKHDVFSYLIKRARLKIESLYEINLQFQNATGSIFALKNMGWTDKQEITGKDGSPFNSVLVTVTSEKAKQAIEKMNEHD